MEEEGNKTMIKACFQPEASEMATAIFNAIRAYSSESSKVTGGMGISFNGIDKIELVKYGKMFRNINLVRYEPYIDMYANGLRELYRIKDKDNG